jgi:D-inositol-3-phosphate glycosyltransferase
MNASDRLIAPSRLSAESYRQNGVDREFQIIPDGVDPPPSFSERSKIPDDIVAFAKGKFVLLTVGFLVPEKRIDLAIRVLGRLHRDGRKNTVLIIVGKGRLEGRLGEIIEQEKLGDAVRMVGEVAPQAMPWYYSVADVLVHPSTVDSFSMVCLEAMSYGRAVICTSEIGLSEYLHSGKDAIVIAPNDANALHRAVLSLIQNASLVRMLGQQARLTATHLSWANQVREIEQVYEEVSHNRSA